MPHWADCESDRVPVSVPDRLMVPREDRVAVPETLALSVTVAVRVGAAEAVKEWLLLPKLPTLNFRENGSTKYGKMCVRAQTYVCLLSHSRLHAHLQAHIDTRMHTIHTPH